MKIKCHVTRPVPIKRGFHTKYSIRPETFRDEQFSCLI